MLCDTGFPKNFSKFSGKHLYQSHFLKKLKAACFLGETSSSSSPVDILTFEFELCKIRSIIFQNVGWLNQGRFMSEIMVQILAFASVTNLVREVKEVSPNFRRVA